MHILNLHTYPLCRKCPILVRKDRDNDNRVQDEVRALGNRYLYLVCAGMRVSDGETANVLSCLLFFWQYSSGSTPLTGMEAGLLTTTTSSSMCITVIGSEVTGTSCLQHTNRNQLNVALLHLHLHISRAYAHDYIRRHTYNHTRARTHAHIHVECAAGSR